jgi:hypothetical protein
MKTIRKLSLLPTALAALSALTIFSPACKTMTQEEVRKSMEIEILDTKWAMKEYRQWPHPVLKLVPAVVFRIKNLTSEPMKFVNFNAIFREKNAIEERGSNFLAAIRKTPVPPGGWSEPITLKSNWGNEASNLEAYKNNPAWTTLWVKIYAQWKGSRHTLLGEWEVSKKIDFQEPGPPVIQGGKKAEEIKKEEKKK